MESPQSVVSPLKMYPEPEKHSLDHFTRNPSVESKKPDPSVGVLEVYVHQARDIQNICIYHKQDVYAKISLTCNPEKSVMTQTINGGGQNPVFNESLCIDVPTFDTSLKCEIYMMSRVRNYLQDQLLGFALIPLSDVIIKNGEHQKEFTLSSDDIFHSPSGFVQLSLSYNGVSPDVIVIPPKLPPANKTAVPDKPELDKLEFPDPKIVNENEIMVSEYFGISSESLVSSDTDDQASSENGGSFVTENQKPDSPLTSVSTNGSHCASVPDTKNKSSDDEKQSKSASQESDSPLKDKPVESVKDKPVEGGSSNKNQPAASMNFELDQKVVQQDFVDLYMKSMQQFTESLAKMKLPLEMENEQARSGNSSSGNSNSGQNTQTPNGDRPRVFYGSRAFF